MPDAHLSAGGDPDPAQAMNTQASFARGACAGDAMRRPLQHPTRARRPAFTGRRGAESTQRTHEIASAPKALARVRVSHAPEATRGDRFRRAGPPFAVPQLERRKVICHPLCGETQSLVGAFRHMTCAIAAVQRGPRRWQGAWRYSPTECLDGPHANHPKRSGPRAIMHGRLGRRPGAAGPPSCAAQPPGRGACRAFAGCPDGVPCARTGRMEYCFYIQFTCSVQFACSAQSTCSAQRACRHRFHPAGDLRHRLEGAFGAAWRVWTRSLQRRIAAYRLRGEPACRASPGRWTSPGCRHGSGAPRAAAAWQAQSVGLRAATRRCLGRMHRPNAEVDAAPRRRPRWTACQRIPKWEGTLHRCTFFLHPLDW